MSSFKIVFNQEIHIFKGSNGSKFQDLVTFIEKSFNNLPKSFVLFYKDQDGDFITISCDQDLQALKSEKNVKIFVQSSQSNSSQIIDEYQMIESKVISSKSPVEVSKEEVFFTDIPSTKSETTKSQSFKSESSKKEEKPCDEKAKPNFGNFFQPIIEQFLPAQSQNCQWMKENWQNLKKDFGGYGGFGGFGGGCGGNKEARKERRKVFMQNLVHDEVNKMLPEIAQYVEKYLSGDKQKKIPEETQQVVHEKYICDGCEMSPIIGVRYKCAVCQDFDLCEKCESISDHEHPFLKIKKPHQSPKAIFLAINEEVDPFLEKVSKQFPLCSQMIKDVQNKDIQTNPSSSQHFFQSISVPDEQPQEMQIQKEKKNKGEEKKSKGEKKKKQKKLKLKKKVTEEKVYSWTEQNKANIILDVIGGGNFEDYLQMVSSMPSEPIENIIENILLQQVEEIPVKKQPKKKIIKNEKEPIVEKKESIEKKEPIEKKVSFEILKKVYESMVLIKATQVAQILGGNPEDYYEIIDAIKYIPLDEMLILLLEQQAQQTEQQQQQQKQKPIKQVSFKEETPKVEQEKQQTPKEKEQQQQQKQEEPKKKTFDQGVMKKAKDVQQVCLGKEEDYYEICSLLTWMNAAEIVETVMAERQLNDERNKKRPQETPTTTTNDSEKEQPKKQLKMKEEIPQEPKKVLKKDYQKAVKDKALKLAEVLGANPEIYYQLVDVNAAYNLNDLLEMVLSDPTLLEKNSSYKQ